MKEFYYTIGECDYRKDLAERLPAGTCVLFPASSYIPRKRVPVLPKNYQGIRAADSGGFVASFKHGGQYQYSPTEYVDWLNKWQPHWAATMDYCCENEITSGKPGIVRERQRKTTEMLKYFWMNYQAAPWTWIPTVQGWEVEDYQRHARELKPLIELMADDYGPDSFFRVGIGTLCRRASARMIREVVNAVAAELPDCYFHLWGVKLDFLKSAVALPPQVLSADSAAWNGDFGSDRGWWKGRGQSRSKQRYEIALPLYDKKLKAALAEPKQMSMGL